VGISYIDCILIERVFFKVNKSVTLNVFYHFVDDVTMHFV